MSYCVGILVDEGLALVSDSRTNAGIDRVSTFQKSFVFEKRGERVFGLICAGNLSITQSVTSILNQELGSGDPKKDLFAVPNTFEAARVVGAAVRNVHQTDGEALRQHDVEFNASFVFGGQIKGRDLRLFQLYAAGNFIEATRDTPFLQIGEIKYGKPILDRIVTPSVSLVDAAKCALISFDSTMRSNVSVGPPIDVTLYRRNSLAVGLRVRLEERDGYLQTIHRLWGDSLQKAFYDTVPNPDWSI